MYTYLFVHEKRGTGAIQSNKSILTHYFGWLVHDCWGSYFKLEHLKHAICGAHILRELESLIENPVSYTHLDVYKRQVQNRFVVLCPAGGKKGISDFFSIQKSFVMPKSGDKQSCRFRFLGEGKRFSEFRHNWALNSLVAQMIARPVNAGNQAQGRVCLLYTSCRLLRRTRS